MKNTRKTSVVLGLLAFVLCGVWDISFATRDSAQNLLPAEPLTIINAAGRPSSFMVELATTPAEQEKGLMFRRSLAPDAGMLFIFPRPQVQDFWMKNTILPLDMLFIRKDGIVDSIAANAVPYSEANIFSAGPVIATLEVPAGTAARLDLQPDNKVIARQFAN